MSDETLLEGIRAIARKHLRYEGPLEPETPLVESMQLDSVRMVMLLVEVEDHFGVSLEDADEAEIRTVGQLMDALRERLPRE